MSPGEDAKAFADGESEWLTGIPSVTNADTLGIRPDLVGRPVTSWADLLDPAFKGKSALQDKPTIGIIDVAMAIEARGDIKYGNKGNMTRAEIDKTMAIDDGDQAQRASSARSGRTFDQSVNLMASGEVVIQSMWSPAVSAVRARGIPCTYPAAQGGLSRLGLYARHDEAPHRAEARLRPSSMPTGTARASRAR